MGLVGCAAFTHLVVVETVITSLCFLTEPIIPKSKVSFFERN